MGTLIRGGALIRGNPILLPSAPFHFRNEPSSIQYQVNSRITGAKYDSDPLQTVTWTNYCSLGHVSLLQFARYRQNFARTIVKQWQLSFLPELTLYAFELNCFPLSSSIHSFLVERLNVFWSKRDHPVTENWAQRLMLSRSHILYH